MGRWSKPCRFADFFVRYRDAATLVLLLQQHFVHQFVERAILERATLVKRDAGPESLLFLLLEIGNRILPRGQHDIFAVDRRDRGGGGDRSAT